MLKKIVSIYVSRSVCTQRLDVSFYYYIKNKFLYNRKMHVYDVNNGNASKRELWTSVEAVVAAAAHLASI